MFEHRSEEEELMDGLALGGEDLGKNLVELEICNRLFGSNKALIYALNTLLDAHPEYFKNNKLIIADLGCGSGDQIMAMDNWTKFKKLNIEFIGIDANPYMIHDANLKNHTANNIKYKTLNIFSPEFAKMQFDIITVSSVCHHFRDKILLELLSQLSSQARLAVIINDLHRHWLSYYSIKCVAKIFNFSPLGQVDGPLSVLRAFRKKELISLLQQANLHSYQIDWAWAFRWIVILQCLNAKEKT